MNISRLLSFLLMFLLPAFSFASDRNGDATYKITSVFFESIINSEYLKEHGFSNHEIEFPSYRISEKRKRVSVFDREDTKPSFCEEKTGWLCIQSHLYKFSFPLDELKDRWEFEGVDYYLIGRTKVEVLGKEIDVLYIYSKEPLGEIDGNKVERRMVHLFSTDYGLIGFGEISDDTGEAAISYSVSMCGYGAIQEECIQ